jgi:hypothetical protein
MRYIAFKFRGILGEITIRQPQVAERIGVGFELPSKNVVVGPNGPKPEVGDVELLAVNT